MHNSDDAPEVPEVYLQEFLIPGKLLFEDLTSLAHLAGTGTLRLNFTGIHRIYASHISQFLALRNKTIQQGGQITLCNLEPAVYEVLLQFSLDRLFHIDTTDGDE